MKRTHERLLIATLAGIVIAGAAAFAIQPALATGFGVQPRQAIAAVSYDVLTLRLGEKL